MEHSTRHTVIFTVVLCVVFSVLVSSVAVGLRDRQIENQKLDRIKNVLGVAGLAEPGESLSNDELNRAIRRRSRDALSSISRAGEDVA